MTYPIANKQSLMRRGSPITRDDRITLAAAALSRLAADLLDGGAFAIRVESDEREDDDKHLCFVTATAEKREGGMGLS